MRYLRLLWQRFTEAYIPPQGSNIFDSFSSALYLTLDFGDLVLQGIYYIFCVVVFLAIWIPILVFAYGAIQGM